MTELIFNNIWLVPGIPFLSFVIVGLGLQFISKPFAVRFATVSIFASAFCAVSASVHYFSLYPAGAEHPTLIPFAFEWLSYQQYLGVSMGVLADPLSLLLMVVVTSVSSLVHLYSLGYMKGDPGIGRFYTVLNLFTFSMLGLVVAPNLLQTFVFWELVGASSFFLIGFYYTKPSAVSASKKAFIVTRFADLGLLLGIMLLGFSGYGFIQDALAQNPDLLGAQALDFAYLSHPFVIESLKNIDSGSTLTLALILLFIGAAGKSAMFPLHIWLPDAMEGPTPVSALIHAATMVVAGVYLVARLFPLFAAAPIALDVVAYVGTFTCLFAAIIACTQDDIKRVLAFSTLSQIGYMMLALGVTTLESGAGYSASIFHLFTHAFFKALLFLGAGSIIHAVHSNSVWEMGGLRKKMPWTHLTFLIATLAIAGIPPLAGFFSKDEILLAALNSGSTVIFAVAFAVAGMTSFYMFRIYFLSFWGKARSDGASHAHESPPLMIIPLLVLAIMSVVAGWVPFSSYLSIGAPAAGHHSSMSGLMIPITATTVGVVGAVFAAILYFSGDARKSQRIASGLGSVYTIVRNKFYIDELYLFVTKRIIFQFVAAPAAWFDRHVVDASMNLSAWATQKSGSLLRRWQTGQVQSYSFWLVLGTLAVCVFFWIASFESWVL